MALFQTQATENIETENENTGRINQDFKNELNSIYSDRKNTIQKRQEEESLYVKNLISPERIKEWQDKGKMSAIEVWNRKSKNELIPYMSTFKEGEKSFKIKGISDKIRNGQYITPEEREQFDNFILDMAEIQTRGYSFGGGATNIGLETLPFMAEFAIGLLTTGGGASFASSIAKGGIKATAKEIGKTVAKEVAEEGLAKTIAKGAGQTLYNATLNPATYKFAGTRLPQQVYARMGDIQLSDSMYVTPEGQTVLKEAETKPATAFMKALALTNIETASEMSGEILVRPIMQGLGKIVAPKVLRQMASKTFPEKFVKLAEQATNMPFARAVDTLGWNGVLEEIGEERIGDLLKFAFNLDDKEGYSFEQLLDAVFPSSEQLGQEALAFAVTGAGMNAVHGTLNKVSPKYNKDGFLLDSGIFRVAGYDNLVDKRVKSILKEQGKSEEEIENAVQFSSREDKIEFLKQNNMNLDDDIKEVQEDYKQTLLADGVSEEKADFASKIYATLQTSRADRTGRTLEELHAENNLKIKEVEDEYYQDMADFYENYAEEKGLNQLAQVAGAESGEYADALKEWQERGTESPYFKRWFGDSKVVDENGKPLVVYHGSPEEFEEFDSKKSLYGKVSEGFNFFTNKKNAYPNSAQDYADFAGTDGYNRHGKVYEIYLTIKNPLHIKYTSNGMSVYNGEKRYSTPVEYYDTNYKEIKEEYSKGNYDGIIIENTDKNDDDSVIYLVPNSRQIKSVNNQGTFDAENPNIYFQSAYHGSPHKFDEFSTNYMGSGEGAQAHGWGLYFAENEKLADNRYRKAQIADEGVKVNGKTYIKKNTNYVEKETEEYSGDELEDAIRYFVETGNKKDAINLAKKIGKGYLENNSEGMAKYYERVANTLEKNHFEFVNNGQLYKVDIPEKEYLLDEDKPFTEQSKTVQNAIKKIAEDISELAYADPKRYFETEDKLAKMFDGQVPQVKISTNILKSEIENNPEELTGHDIYHFLSEEQFGSNHKRITSKLLNEHGIKGITYNGKQDGRCYVIFDDKAVKILETYYQEEPEQQSVFEENNQARNIRKIKGAYMPAENLIEFFKNADESTIVHEFAHWYLENLVNDAKYHEASAEDLAEVRKFVRNNGEDFTREQHEKFARGFEAYIRSGRARTNRLKRIFEDFKNALLQIYDTITQIVYTENGVEKPFTEEDLPQINSLFERLLSTENERIQATVFDKVNEIEDKINDIKENQQKEFDELDTIYRDNIEILNRKSDQKRQVEEYLEMAEQASRREPKEVREWKKRYKDVTLNILEVATGYKRQFIANPRNWEKVQDAFEGTDRITASDGMHAEWREFYPDTGVSYDNDEVDGDNKLAQMAFDVMTDGQYNKIYSEDYGWEEIEKFTGKFDYLESKVKSLRGEEQRNALDALYKLAFDNVPEMPEAVYEEFVHRIAQVSDKVEAISQEQFNRKHYPNIPVVQQLQFYVTHKLDKLKIYNPETRYRTRLDRSHGLYKSIKNATSVNDTKRIIQKINNFMIEDLRNNQRAILHKEIQKQIKINSKLVKVGSIKRGKFDWRTNTIFAELVQMNKLSQEEAGKQFDELLKLNELEAGEERIDWRNDSSELSESMNSDFQDNLKRKFLQYKSSRTKSLDVSHTSSLLEDILKLKFEGRRAKSEEDFKKQTERFDYRNNLIQILDRHKENKTAKFLTNWVVGSGTLPNWETLLNTVFDAETAKKYSLQNLEAQVQVFARNKTLELINKANRIYGFENNKWDKTLDYDGMQKFIKLMQDYANEIYDYSETTWNKETFETVQTGLKLSRAEIMTLFTWSLNDELLQRLNNQYGLNQLQDMFSKLSEQDKQMCWEFVNICESMYDAMNEVYIETYGISLPKVQNYFPSVTERVGSDLDMFHDFVVKSSNPSFIKQRKTCNKIPMKPKQPLEILLPHINKSANYILMSETVNFYNKIFKETPLNKKIIDVYGKKDGEKIVRAIQNQLSASTFTTVARGLNFAHEFADNLATNFISSSIAGSPKVMLGQLLSCINYAENMPAHKWQAGFLKGLAKPKETFKYMLDNCEYLQARLAGNTQNEMMSTLTSEVDRFRTVKNFCSLTTKWGDILAIVFGGKPYVDYLIEQGMSKEEAFNKFVDDTLRAQQAGLNSTTSEWQKAQTKTAMGRAFFAFNNTNLQYERKFIDALSKLSKGDITTAQFAKSYLIYKVLNPIMFTSILGNLSLLELMRALIGGDDDPNKALQTFGSDILLAIMLGSLGAYGLAGLIAIQLINYGKAIIDKKIFSEKPYVFEKKTPILSEVDMIGKKAMKKEWTFADTIDVAGAVGNLSTGLPVERAFNLTGGLVDISQGEFGIGATRMLGYGEYKATNAWTGKSPKEKKKNKK